MLACEALRDIAALEDDLLAVVVEGELGADVTLFAVAQNVVQPRSCHVERAMQVIRSDCSQREPLVVALHEVGQEGIATFNVADAGHAKLLNQAMLQSAVRSLDAAL